MMNAKAQVDNRGHTIEYLNDIYLRLDTSNGPLTGNLTISKLQAEFFLTDTTPASKSWSFRSINSALEVIDRTANIRRGVFGSNGEVYLGGTISDSGGTGAVVDIQETGAVTINGVLGVKTGSPTMFMDATNGMYMTNATDNYIKTSYQGPIQMLSGVTDSVNNAGYVFNTKNTLSASGTAIARFQNAGTTRIAITPGGIIAFSSILATLRSGVADSASAIGTVLNTQNTFITAGSKLLSVQNNSAEEFYLDYRGLINGGGAADQVLAMNGAATEHEYKTMQGTLNEISITHAAGQMTFSTPQPLATSSPVQFGQLGLGVAVGGSNLLTLLAGGTIGAAGDLNLDLQHTSNKTFYLKNTSTGVANMDIDGALTVAGIVTATSGVRVPADTYFASATTDPDVGIYLNSNVGTAKWLEFHSDGSMTARFDLGSGASRGDTTLVNSSGISALLFDASAYLMRIGNTTNYVDIDGDGESIGFASATHKGLLVNTGAAAFVAQAAQLAGMFFTSVSSGSVELRNTAGTVMFSQVAAGTTNLADFIKDVRARAFLADGDPGAGVTATITFAGVTDTPTTDPGWVTAGMNAPDGYAKFYIGTQAAVFPYWIT